MSDTEMQSREAEEASQDERSRPPSDDDEDAVDLRPGHGSNDSSEEEATDSEEEREVRKGFIVDESESRRRRKKKKRSKRREGGDGDDDEGEGRESRKRRKGSDDEDGDLDEDDLELLQENLGGGFKRSKSKSKLKRLRRHQRSGSPSSDASGSPRNTGDLNDIFNDDDDDEPRGASSSRRGGAGGDAGAGIEGLFDADEMAGFIEDDSDDDDDSRRGGSSPDDSDEDADSRRRRKEKKRRAKKEEARKRRQQRSGMGLGGMGRVEGITAEAWGEVAEVFGNGMDYAWAFEEEGEEEGAGEDKGKELKDIFEPSEIASRMLTEADEKIRTLDVPERLQLINAGLPPFTHSATTGELDPLVPASELRAAALWMSDKLSAHTTQFVLRDEMGNPPPLQLEFLTAVEHVVRFVNVDFLEPPHIWHHRSDYLFHAPSGTEPRALLTEGDVWRISALSIQYRAYLSKRAELRSLWARIGVQDHDAEEVMEQLVAGEEVSDAVAWVVRRWGDKVRDAAKREGEEGALGAEGEEDGVKAVAGGVKRPKRARGEDAYERAKANVVSKLAEMIAIPSTALSLDVAAQTKTHYPEDPTSLPLDLASEHAGTDEYPTAQDALDAAKFILVTELSAEPLLRKEARRVFREFAVVSVEATKVGEAKIDQLNPFYAFKYLKPKPISEFLRSPQWLQILAAEIEGLVTVTISLPPAAYDRFYDTLRGMYLSDFTSALADEWNDLRAEVLKKAIDGSYLKEGELFVRGFLKEEAEEHVMALCRLKLEKRIDAAPWCRGDGTMQPGEIPSVLALSNGNGDPRRDTIMAIFLDADGHLREHLTLDRLDDAGADPAQIDAFTELLRRRRPQIVVVGGFRPAAVNLMSDFRRLAARVSDELRENGDADDEDEEADNSMPYEEKETRKRNRAEFESTFVFDDVARIYQNSARAAAEFTELSALGKYCVGLARYVQSPLNEYAALGSDLSALMYNENQKFLTKEKLNQALDRALIDVTNKVGVDINKAVRNQYYSNLLPYVAGLGPRKADAVIKKINAQGGTLATRSGLVMHQIMTKNIWVNASAFLRIRQDDLAADLGRDTENEEDPDVLDDTRIHPEDYDVARKMAADAMEYDEEDLEGAAASKAVNDLLEDDVRKLNELALDEFAEELTKVLQQPKRLTLYRIREELQHPYGEKRVQFEPPNDVERFTMFTGETRATLDAGLIIPVRVLRVAPDEMVIVRLDCGIEGNIAAEFRTDSQTYSKLKPGQTLQAVVMEIRYAEMRADLTTQETLVGAGDLGRRMVRTDAFFDGEKAAARQHAAGQGKAKQTGRVKRIINHPNFQDVSAGKAEELLSNMQRGDCIIRPSSREDHLAVTWKVDEGLYQHIAVHELNKPNEYSIGTQLRVSDKHRYSDLDELIDAHIKQMARKVNEITNSDRWKGSRESLDKFLTNWTLANPGRSSYAYGWNDDRQRPGTILLGFKANEKAPPASWTVTVVPEGYMLKGEVHGDVQSLSNAFKRLYLLQMQGGARLNPNLGGGKTPFLQGRTPNPYAAAAGTGRTPNPYAAVAGTGRTPNPYAAAAGTGRTPNPYAAAGSGRTPNPAMAGGRTPGYGGPPSGYGAPAPVPPQFATGANAGGPPPGAGYGGGYGGGGRTPQAGMGGYGAPPGVQAAQAAQYGGGRTPMNGYGR
ncbi:hypothetical protein JCM6882_008048 [Rhodosporidiobolus microsporus]